MLEINFYNDKKEKYMSCEASVNVELMNSDFLGHGSFTATGYGYTEEEAKSDLYKILEHLKEKLND